MNPYKNINIDSYGCFFLILITILSLFIVVLSTVLNPMFHKKNTEKLKQSKPLAQQYLLNQSDPVWFYKPDELEWTKGEVIYLWGYHPVVYSKQLNKTFEFHEIEWIVGNE